MESIENNNLLDLQISELKNKLSKAQVLNDYAIENNYDVQDETIKLLASVQARLIENKFEKVSLDLDVILKTLTKLIYPTNYESIMIARSSYNRRFSLKRFRWQLIIISIFFLTTGTIAYSLICKGLGNVKIFASIISISLGVLGSLVYIMFNLIGILNESAFNAKDTFSNYIRIVLGGMLGWIFYFGFAQESFNSCDINNENYIYLFLPFLVGFSTKLVVGVLNQLIKAFELILDIDSKDADLLNRRKSKK